jgi:hypothetical protein
LEICFGTGQKQASGCWTKEPIDIHTGRHAKADDSKTWCDFPTAVRNYGLLQCDGIGLCLTADYVFIDLDGVFGPDGNSVPFPWAERIITLISGRAYLEKSITGTGLHGVGRGVVPPGRREFDDRNRPHTGYAFYDRNRFFTFSGNVLPGSAEICDLTPQLATLHRELFPGPKPRSRGHGDVSQHATNELSLNDSELLERARAAANADKFSRLWAGDWSDYPSRSEADSALCCMLAFWTGRDIKRIDRLFRQSGLMREKWLRDDYRDNTIRNACCATSEVWEPRRRNGTHMAANTPESSDSTFRGAPEAGSETCGESEGGTGAKPGIAAAGPVPKSGVMPRICANGRQLRDISEEALSALQAANDPRVLFTRSGMMVAIVRDEKQRQVIGEVGLDALCGRLSRCADFYKVTASGDHSNCLPPTAVVKDILALAPGEWGLQPLEAVTEAPVLRPDGTILDTYGYDPMTHLYYAPEPNLRMPALDPEPSSDHIQMALGLIHQAIGEFPYADGASYANAIAAMLTPIIKPAISAPAPLGLLDAPQAGTGKSLLCDMIAGIATGRAGEMFSAPKDEDEWRKVITTALMGGTPVVIFDNVTRPLENGDLCQVLTATTWADRAMKTHNKISLPVQATFLASGNNVRLGGDMPRRCYRVRLDAKCSAPFLRRGPEQGKSFTIEQLFPWTIEHRGELLAALLTLARAWYVAGKPKPKIRPIGSYEAWTITVGGILERAGVKGFMANAAELYEEADDESREWEGLLLVLHEIFYSEPFTVADIVEKMNGRTSNPAGYGSEPTAHTKALKSALPGFLAEAMDRDGFFQKRTGRAFAAQTDRRFGKSGVYMKRGTLLSGRQQWEVIVPGEKNDHERARSMVG